MHPFGPVPVVAFLIDGAGPFSLDSVIEENTGSGIDEDPALLMWLRRAAPGDARYVPIGGGAIRLDAVFSPGFEYTVWNVTDGIPATPEAFATRALAEDFIREFPVRFAAQGYYITSDRYRIDPRCVRLRVEEIAVDDGDLYATRR